MCQPIPIRDVRRDVIPCERNGQCGYFNVLGSVRDAAGPSYKEICQVRRNEHSYDFCRFFEYLVLVFDDGSVQQVGRRGQRARAEETVYERGPLYWGRVKDKLWEFCEIEKAVYRNAKL